MFEANWQIKQRVDPGSGRPNARRLAFLLKGLKGTPAAPSCQFFRHLRNDKNSHALHARVFLQRQRKKAATPQPHAAERRSSPEVAVANSDDDLFRIRRDLAEDA